MSPIIFYKSTTCEENFFFKIPITGTGDLPDPGFVEWNEVGSDEAPCRLV